MIQLSCADSDFRIIGTQVLKGAIVVFPTDTVYGLGTSPFSEEGLLRCIKLKKRDENKPLPVLFSDVTRVRKLVALDERAELLTRIFWPGPLTIIVHPRDGITFPRRLLNSAGCVGVRVPAHECCAKLLEACGGALVGTSANVSGERPSANAEDRNLKDFANGADYFVTGRCGPSGAPSTVIDLSDRRSIRFERVGALSKLEVLSYFENTSKADFSDNNDGISSDEHQSGSL